MTVLRNPAALLLLVLVWVSACRDPTGIGLDLIASDDLITARTDTFTIRTYTVRGDSTNTTNLADYLIGSDDDMVFGRTTAGLYTEFRLLENNLSFTPDTGGAIYIADSLVLTLRLIGEYGDEMVSHNLLVFEMVEEMETSVAYYANSEFDVDMTPVGSRSGYIARPTDSVLVGETLQAPQLRIRLTDGLAQQFLEQSGSANFSSDSSFQTWFNGLFIVPDTSAGFSRGFFRVDPDNSLSRLTLHYHAETDVEERAASQTFIIGSGSNRVGRYTHDYSSAAAAPIACGVDAMPEDYTYISGLAGLRTRIEIPHLDDLGDIAINRALLTFPLSAESAIDSTFTAPPNAYVIRGDSMCRNAFSLILRSDEIYYSVRDQFESGSHYNSVRRMVDLPDAGRVDAYQLNITRELQAILNDEVENNGFVLVSFPFFRSAHRAKVGSATNPTAALRMRLEILYTEVD